MKPEDAISKAEKIIENAIWESEEKEDWDWELAV